MSHIFNPKKRSPRDKRKRIYKILSLVTLLAIWIGYRWQQRHVDTITADMDEQIIKLHSDIQYAQAQGTALQHQLETLHTKNVIEPPSLPPSQVTQYTLCQDSDGNLGHEQIKHRGQVILITQNKTEAIYRDHCTDFGKKVVEYKCADKTAITHTPPPSQIKHCPQGCYEGACR